jgi:HlyD family secretion protein
MKRAIFVLLIIAAIGVGTGAYYIRRGGSDITMNTAPVTHGEIIDTVGATGTLQAVTTVQVGSQVSGNISYLGADFNSIVHKGTVIAKLDPSLFDAQLQAARASLMQAQANFTKAQSDLERAKVQLVDAQQKYTRAKELAARNLVPQSDLDAAKIAVDSAQATLASQQATVAQTQAAVGQAQAAVNQNQVNLDHTIIQAPIDGIVIQRSVDVGQTVAASLQSPTLFIIAADLTKMQVNANIDEADVGRIRPGQSVTFRVDAYPTDEFVGTVAQIRLQPVVVQNVTTYGTIIDVPNKDLKLKPGMTANLKVQIARRADVLRVPNAALRFRPSTDVFAALNQPVPPEVQFGGGGRGGRGGGQRAGGRGRGGDAQPSDAGSTGTPAASAQQRVSPGVTAGRPAGSDQLGQGDARAGGQVRGGGQGGGRGVGRGPGGGDDADRRAWAMERFKSMSPDEQTQFIARMKDRGQDVTAFEQPRTAKAPKKPASQPKYGTAQSGETIDALFAPLPPVESQGRAWLYVDKQLKPVRLRLGITDGTNTELLDDVLEPGSEVVTGVIMSGTRPTGAPGAGNPLLPQRGGGPGRGR